MPLIEIDDMFVVKMLTKIYRISKTVPKRAVNIQPTFANSSMEQWRQYQKISPKNKRANCKQKNSIRTENKDTRQGKKFKKSEMRPAHGVT